MNDPGIRLPNLMFVLALTLPACGGGSVKTGTTNNANNANNTNNANNVGNLNNANNQGGPGDHLFAGDHVLEIAITLADADWAALRAQPRPLAESKTTCARQATEPGYTYFPATITIDGVAVSQVGVRKKGNLGSVSSARPGLRVKPHEYVPGQRLDGLKALTLNNNHQDDTLVSQCLGYGLWRAAGLPASRCAFARVTVNGEDLGIYSVVETIREEMLARHFDDPTGRLYESGGDFVPGHTGGFEPKVDEESPDCGDLEAAAAALGASDDQLAGSVDAVFDLPRFLRFWAMEVVTDHWDGYANNRNNYFVYHDPASDRLHFLPWGIDSLFTGRARTTRPLSVYACGSLAWRLYAAPGTRALYLAALRDVLDTVWDAPTILAELARLEALLRPYVDPLGTGEFSDRLARVRGFVAGREAALRAELDAGDPVWPYAARDSCLVSIGTIDATFDTTWGTLDQWDAGSGTMGGVIGGVDVTTASVWASAGIDEEGKGVLRLLGSLPDGRFAVVWVVINDPARVQPGSLAINLVDVAAMMTFYDPVTDTSSGGGLLLPGTITLTAGAPADGAPLTGSLTGSVLEI